MSESDENQVASECTTPTPSSHDGGCAPPVSSSCSLPRSLDTRSTSSAPGGDIINGHVQFNHNNVVKNKSKKEYPDFCNNHDTETEDDKLEISSSKSLPIQNHEAALNRSLSLHTVSSNNSSDSSTKCSSVSSPYTTAFFTNSWGTTRTSRHVGLQSCFPLVDALLNLCHSADSNISSTAHECLLMLCGVREPVCTLTIARHTLFPHYIAAKIAECVSALPADVDTMMIEDLTLPVEKSRIKSYSERATAAAITPDISSSDSEDNESNVTEEAEEDFPGRRELLRMLHWLAYCDKVSEGVISCTLRCIVLVN